MILDIDRQPYSVREPTFRRPVDFREKDFGRGCRCGRMRIEKRP